MSEISHEQGQLADTTPHGSAHPNAFDQDESLTIRPRLAIPVAPDTLQAESERAISSSPETASNIKESSPVTEKRITRPPNAFILFRADQVKLIKETEPELRSKPQSELSKVRR
ncbi:BZ3500_MvSof-1268-A1-R1_Chr11-2g03381 [Microbotryum saponariae]|uniref:BZ3500_MvSof-1268-A1-R1_Chr11-2g03381 protein n=1 Tax=Microbotryum saponariae TaxID=289078 RepID=A0A2X0NDD6_9BASI|nr:BZ3500_MvSof-1268-A1-R1_Chr11-2g03381 [Microbotryum saponariae]SDA03246.1 BZ3501_MvSof-1269-A2-R1_Chr11g02952 [Microbotryum saponariae]